MAANGTTWAKGVSGNPRGRPPKIAKSATKRAVERTLAPTLRDEPDLATRLRAKLEPICEEELEFCVRQRDNLAAKISAIGLVYDRSRGRPITPVDVRADIESRQFTMFDALGISDPDRVLANMDRIIELKAEQEAADDTPDTNETARGVPPLVAGPEAAP